MVFCVQFLCFLNWKHAWEAECGWSFSGEATRPGVDFCGKTWLNSRYTTIMNLVVNWRRYRLSALYLLLGALIPCALTRVYWLVPYLTNIEHVGWAVVACLLASGLVALWQFRPRVTPHRK